MRSVIPTKIGRGGVMRGGATRGGATRGGATRGGATREDSMNRKLFSNNWGRVNLVHGIGGLNTTLENFFSTEGQGERFCHARGEL